MTQYTASPTAKQDCTECHKTLALAFILGALQPGWVALARPAPIKQEVAWRYRLTQTFAPGKVWADEDGLHIRERVDVGVVSGDIQGIALVVSNADLTLGPVFEGSRPVPGDGVAFGTIQIWSLSPVKGAPFWEGDWTDNIRDGRVVSGELTAMNAQARLFMWIESLKQDGNSVLHEGFYRTRLLTGQAVP